VGVDVDQPRHDEQAASVDRLRGIAGDAGLDGREAALRNRDVTNRIDPKRRIDDPSSFDNQIVRRGLCERVRTASDQRSACGRYLEKPASVYHRSHFAQTCRATLCDAGAHRWDGMRGLYAESIQGARGPWREPEWSSRSPLVQAST
jgi:hypothetical protein